MSEIPRRNRIDQSTDTERAIRAAIDAVEGAGADVRLTDAVILLGAALDSVADFVDGVDRRRFVASPLMQRRGLLCLRCSTITPPDQAADLNACPACGDSRGIPADVADTVQVAITWHELRVLVMWAEFWASAKDDDEHKAMRRIVYGIAGRLMEQHFDKIGLTFANELADLREEFGNGVEQNVIKEDRQS